MQIKVTLGYLESLSKIEDFIFESTNSIRAIEKFHSEHTRVKLFIEQNPNTPAPHPNTGDQSWPFGNGRYRVFFKVVGDSIIYFLDVIDNRMFNEKIYPNNSMPTYIIEE